MIVANVPIAHPLFRSRGEVVHISKSEGEGNPLAKEDAVVNALFEKSLTIQERRRRLRPKRKALQLPLQ